MASFQKYQPFMEDGFTTVVVAAAAGPAIARMEPTIATTTTAIPRNLDLGVCTEPSLH